MELIEVIQSSLIIFFGFVSIAFTFSYVTFKIKDRNRVKILKPSVQLQNIPVSGVYPRMLSVGDSYKIPKSMDAKVSPSRKNIFRHYSFNLSDKMHKLKMFK